MTSTLTGITKISNNLLLFNKTTMRVMFNEFIAFKIEAHDKFNRDLNYSNLHCINTWGLNRY